MEAGNLSNICLLYWRDRKERNTQRQCGGSAEKYIEQNLGEDLSRPVLAGKVFLSEDYVSKLFMKTTGMSLPNYIAERRIERAKEYLRTSSLPISKIAMEVGYGNFPISVKRSGSWLDVRQMNTGAVRNNKKWCQ